MALKCLAIPMIAQSGTGQECITFNSRLKWFSYYHQHNDAVVNSLYLTMVRLFLNVSEVRSKSPSAQYVSGCLTTIKTKVNLSYKCCVM